MTKDSQLSKKTSKNGELVRGGTPPRRFGYHLPDIQIGDLIQVYKIMFLRPKRLV